MNRRAGFTLIELLITMIVMVILLGLAVVNLRANQITARDDERKTDITVIAQQLEEYYRTGSSPSSTYKPGQYPPIDLVNTETNLKLALRDISVKALRAPGVGDASTMSFGGATSVSEPSPSTQAYIYQPLTTAGTLCQTASEECRKFTLFYKLESDGTVQKLVSKSQ